MTNNDIKHREAGELRVYLDSLDRRDRAEFIKWVAKECDIARPVFYGWCYMTSRIPEYAKRIIEKCAGKKIFDLNVITFSSSDFELDYDTTQT